MMSMFTTKSGFADESITRFLTAQELKTNNKLCKLASKAA